MGRGSFSPRGYRSALFGIVFAIGQSRQACLALPPLSSAGKIPVYSPCVIPCHSKHGPLDGRSARSTCAVSLALVSACFSAIIADVFKERRRFAVNSRSGRRIGKPYRSACRPSACRCLGLADRIHGGRLTCQTHACERRGLLRWRRPWLDRARGLTRTPILPSLP